VTLPADWRFVVATSGVVAEKAGNARERYNRAARGVGALLDLWNRARRGEPPDPSLAAALASQPGAEPRLRALLDDRLELHLRLTHFLREDARAPQAARAFRDADDVALGALSLASQRDAEELLGNQIPETVALADLARRLGAFAACGFGAGFGGAVWALVRCPGAGRIDPAAGAGAADDAHDFARRWLGAYRELYPQHLEADAFATLPGPGLLELSRPL
jgi:galactokinase